MNHLGLGAVIRKEAYQQMCVLIITRIGMT
jgi:hypothetical protein